MQKKIRRFFFGADLSFEMGGVREHEIVRDKLKIFHDN